MSLHLLSHAEQVAAYLRDEMQSGRWKDTMPGVAHLKRELGVNHVTINAALHLLEEQGLLVSQGPKRRRRIASLALAQEKRSLRVRVLLYDQDSRQSHYALELLGHLQHAGFQAHFARKTLIDLGMDLQRVARYVGSTKADAWVVVAGSRDILAWFAEQSIPSMALFGRFSGLNIAAASPRVATAMRAAVRRLVDLGHRRIVMLVREERRLPTPALVEQTFLNELEVLGVKTGSYNLPDWEGHAEGLLQCLDDLFRHTPPTAIIFGEPRLCVAAQQHLARRGILAPEQVSLLCSEADPTLAWCRPAIAHFDCDYLPVVQRAIRWAKNISTGKTDTRQTLIAGRFVEGGTIGPALASGGESNKLLQTSKYRIL